MRENFVSSWAPFPHNFSHILNPLAIWLLSLPSHSTAIASSESNNHLPTLILGLSSNSILLTNSFLKTSLTRKCSCLTSKLSSLAPNAETANAENPEFQQTPAQKTPTSFLWFQLLHPHEKFQISTSNYDLSSQFLFQTQVSARYLPTWINFSKIYLNDDNILFIIRSKSWSFMTLWLISMFGFQKPLFVLGILTPAWDYPLDSLSTKPTPKCFPSLSSSPTLLPSAFEPLLPKLSLRFFQFKQAPSHGASYGLAYFSANKTYIQYYPTLRHTIKNDNTYHLMLSSKYLRLDY